MTCFGKMLHLSTKCLGLWKTSCCAYALSKVACMLLVYDCLVDAAICIQIWARYAKMLMPCRRRSAPLCLWIT